MSFKIDQPETKKESPIYRGGSSRSIAKLESLNFDPIERTVMVYESLLKEIEEQNKIRDGLVIRLRADGKPRAYDVRFHMELYSKLAEISDKLMRYKYGRVSETEKENPNNSKSLVIKLSSSNEEIKVNYENG
jgi:hypothetical protein